MGQIRWLRFHKSVYFIHDSLLTVLFYVGALNWAPFPAHLVFPFGFIQYIESRTSHVSSRIPLLSEEPSFLLLESKGWFHFIPISNVFVRGWFARWCGMQIHRCFEIFFFKYLLFMWNLRISKKYLRTSWMDFLLK